MSLMGPETGRCRRTDGKTWRCLKDVVPDQKYCERHMHRGRSTKRVEAFGVNLQSNSHTITCSNTDATTPTCSTKTSQKIKSHNLAVTSAKLSTPISGNCQNKNPSPCRSNDLTKSATSITTLANGKSKPTNRLVKKDKSSSRENTDCLDGVDAGSNQLKDTNKGYSTNGDKHGASVTPELGNSTESVVYGDTMEESQRCKRTDGKRWQCSREAIPQEKYCGSHINRGSKRCRLSPEAATAAATLATLVTLKNGPSPTNLNTDLCILHATHPPTVLESSTSGIK
ncbi:growth-regulating factor 9 isoform X2 [Daucus carota subsp. sativus]|uniref:growth-regulating factor 9 isoform X2 n=1 Tax=Daucus carota subsp. sativus TaxID=79200 RepID=UPI0007EFA68C|nr:PREDICTED: growth-regulating factor 9 isoform X2 [Daucus carota subsp. sativus]